MLMVMSAVFYVLPPFHAGLPLGARSCALQGIIVRVGGPRIGTLLRWQVQERLCGVTTMARLWTTAVIGVAGGMGRALAIIVGAGLAELLLALLSYVVPQADLHD